MALSGCMYKDTRKKYMDLVEIHVFDENNNELHGEYENYFGKFNFMQFKKCNSAFRQRVMRCLHPSSHQQYPYVILNQPSIGLMSTSEPTRLEKRWSSLSPPSPCGIGSIK